MIGVVNQNQEHTLVVNLNMTELNNHDRIFYGVGMMNTLVMKIVDGLIPTKIKKIFFLVLKVIARQEIIKQIKICGIHNTKENVNVINKQIIS